MTVEVYNSMTVKPLTLLYGTTYIRVTYEETGIKTDLPLTEWLEAPQSFALENSLLPFLIYQDENSEAELRPLWCPMIRAELRASPAGNIMDRALLGSVKSFQKGWTQN